MSATVPVPTREPARAPGEPLRVAFVGQRTFFEACALGDEHAGTRTTFVEHRAGADPGPMLAELAAFGPDVVVAFRPEVLPAGVLRDLDAAILGFLTEPLPREPGEGGRDLAERAWWLRQVDRGNVDRVVAFDPLVADLAGSVLPVWRSVPLPVADRLYAPAQAPRTPPRAMFVGRSTPHREAMLTAAKHRYDLLHVAFGVDVDRLAGLMREHDVAVNLHTDGRPSFENRVALHLAAGHLVLSEPLEPAHGLVAGTHFVEVRSSEDVVRALEVLERHPRTWEAVRTRGRLAAERFRASRVYPRLVADLLADLAVFGSHRRR